MPKITGVHQTSRNPDRIFRVRREYPSPNGKWTLVLNDPWEWRKGATRWKAQLWSHGHDGSARHPRGIRIAGGENFRVPDDIQPWAHDEQSIALLTWDVVDPLYIYRPKDQSVCRPNVGRVFPHSAQWAFDRDRLLLPLDSGGRLYDSTGRHHGTADWVATPDKGLYTAWTRWGVFFHIGREPEAATRLSFYDGDGGQFIESLDLDPLTLVPYDSGTYAAVSRSRSALVIGPGSRGVGHLLDIWHDVRYDAATDTLLLATYRPTASPYQEHDLTMCAVQEQWLAVTLAA